MKSGRNKTIDLGIEEGAFYEEYKYIIDYLKFLENE